MASKILGKHIIIEVIALAFLIFAIIYASYAIKKSQDNKVESHDGMVTVLDDSNFQGLKISSDGEGFQQKGITYTITNNNEDIKEYNVVITPNIHNDAILSQIVIGLDDMYTISLNDLKRDNGGYILTTHKLKPGYTKIHLIKMWYKLDSKTKVSKHNVEFDYRIGFTEN